MINFTEQIKFRTELNRELLNKEVDDNFKFVANPWSPNRTYRKGEIVYNETEAIDTNGFITGGTTGVFWFIAKTFTTKGIFIDNEWEIFGTGATISTSGLISNAFDKILVNSTSIGTFSTTSNTIINAIGEDIFEIAKGSGIQIEHDVSKNLIKFSTLLNPTLSISSFELSLGNEIVDLSPLVGGYWEENTTDLYAADLSKNVGIGTNSPSAKLHINGDLVIETLNNTLNTNFILITDPSGYIDKREANIGIWNTTQSMIYGSGTAKYISKWNDSSSLNDSIIYQDSNKIGIGTTTLSELLTVNGAIKLGSAHNNTIGSIRWSGTDFEGRMSSGWVSLTTAIVSQEVVEDFVGEMVQGLSTQTGISVSYTDMNGKLNFIVDSFDLELIGDLTGSVTIDWTSSNYQLNVSASSLSITLGTNTTGDYIQSITGGNGILIANGTGESADTTITAKADNITIKNNGGLGDELEVIKVPFSHEILGTNGISVGNYTTLFNGSIDVTHTVGVQPDIVGGLNLAKSISVNTNGVAIKIDDITIVENISNQLSIGTILNSNLEFDWINLNGHQIALGDTLYLSIEDIDGIEIPTGGASVGQVLQYTSQGVWEPCEMIEVPGNVGEVIFSNGSGMLDTNSTFVFEETMIKNKLHLRGEFDTDKIILNEANFGTPGDFQVEMLSGIAYTSNGDIVEIRPDGNTEEVYVPEDSVVSFRIKITGIRVGGDSITGVVGDSWVKEFVGAMKNVANTTSLVGTEVTEISIARDTDTLLWNAFISADNVNDKIKIEVQGVPDTQIRWGALIELTTVRFNF